MRSPYSVRFAECLFSVAASSSAGFKITVRCKYLNAASNFKLATGGKEFHIANKGDQPELMILNIHHEVFLFIGLLLPLNQLFGVESEYQVQLFSTRS